MTILIPGKMYTFSQLYLTYENIDKFEREGNSGVIYSDEPFVLVKIADRPRGETWRRIYTGKVHWVKILRCDSEAKDMLVWVAAIPESFISA